MCGYIQNASSGKFLWKQVNLFILVEDMSGKETLFCIFYV